MTEIWTGWKEICEALGSCRRTIKHAQKYKGLPIFYPFGKRPQLAFKDYYEWLKNQPSEPLGK